MSAPPRPYAGKDSSERQIQWTGMQKFGRRLRPPVTLREAIRNGQLEGLTLREIAARERRDMAAIHAAVNAMIFER